MKPVYLLCGVPGSGKSFMPHDDYPTDRYARAIATMAAMSEKPILAECPFRMAVLMSELERDGLTLHAYFIKEPEHLIAARYQAREGKPIPRQHLTNYRRLLAATDRTWIVGSQKEILELLKAV